MSRLGYCVPCGMKGNDVDAVVVIDGDPMCRHCARGEGVQFPAVVVEPSLEEKVQLAVRETEFARIHRRLESRNRNPPGRICPHGCGQPKHRARCAGMSRPKVMTGPKCAHPECERRVRRDNRSKVCFAHYNWSRTKPAYALMAKQECGI